MVLGQEAEGYFPIDIVLFFFLIYFSIPPSQVILNPTTNGPKHTEYHRMIVPKNSQDTELKLKLAVRMDKPPNMKHSGWVTCYILFLFSFLGGAVSVGGFFFSKVFYFSAWQLDSKEVTAQPKFVNVITQEGSDLTP